MKKGKYVNHYSFQIVDSAWVHLLGAPGDQDVRASTVRWQVILTGHEYIACQAQAAGSVFVKEGAALPWQ